MIGTPAAGPLLSRRPGGIARGVFVALLSVATAGCAYNVQPSATKAVNIYSSYENKIPGKWILVLDPSIKDVSRDVKPATYICSAHHYPVQFGESLAVSLKSTFMALVDEIEERATLPSTDELAKLGAAGSAVVRLDDFSPRLTCSMGFWSGSCTATAELTVGLNARRVDGKAFATAVTGSKTADGDSGPYCGAASAVLADASTKAMRDMLERLAERIANAANLRGELKAQ